MCVNHDYNKNTPAPNEIERKKNTKYIYLLYCAMYIYTQTPLWNRWKKRNNLVISSFKFLRTQFLIISFCLLCAFMCWLLALFIVVLPMCICCIHPPNRCSLFLFFSPMNLHRNTFVVKIALMTPSYIVYCIL